MKTLYSKIEIEIFTDTTCVEDGNIITKATVNGIPVKSVISIEGLDKAARYIKDEVDKNLLNELLSNMPSADTFQKHKEAVDNEKEYLERRQFHLSLLKNCRKTAGEITKKLDLCNDGYIKVWIERRSTYQSKTPKKYTKDYYLESMLKYLNKIFNLKGYEIFLAERCKNKAVVETVYLGIKLK